MRPREQAFTLVEMMVTTAIIGVLAALALPVWDFAVAKSRQVEAKGNLASVFDLETAYFNENGTYGNLIDVNFSPEGSTRYSYCVDPSGSDCTTAIIDP